MKDIILWTVLLCLTVFLSGVGSSAESGVEMEEFPGLKKPESMEDRVWERLLYRVEKGKESNVPVHFYGKITDQNNNPVPGVQIIATILGYNEQALEEWLKSREDKTEAQEISEQKRACLLLQSDPNGLFCVENMLGYSLKVEYLKEGYLSPQEKKYFDPYGKGQTHTFQKKESPEVFPIWQMSSSLPELTTNQFEVTMLDPNTYCIDLLRQKIITERDECDFICTYKIKKQKMRYDWTFQIEATDGGGISETNEIFMFLAPEKYKDKWFFAMDKNEKHWSRQIRKNFYIKSRNGKQFANIRINLFVYPDGRSRLNIQSFINSSGSKNLERIPTIDRKMYEEFVKQKLIRWKEKLIDY